MDINEITDFDLEKSIKFEIPEEQESPVLSIINNDNTLKIKKENLQTSLVWLENTEKRLQSSLKIRWKIERSKKVSFKQNDIVKFADTKKVLVIDSIIYNDEEYVFVNEILDDEITLTNKYKIMLVDYATVSLRKITDLDLLSVLLPQFEYRLKKQLQDMDK